jgi:hypothetical protein
LPLSYVTGPHTVAFTYAKANNSNVGGADVVDSNAKMTMLGYTYALSKRTSVGGELVGHQQRHRRHVRRLASVEQRRCECCCWYAGWRRSAQVHAANEPHVLIDGCRSRRGSKAVKSGHLRVAVFFAASAVAPSHPPPRPGRMLYSHD